MNKKQDNIKGEVLHLLKKGDRKAFRFVFDTYYVRLYSFALNYVEDNFIAEEIVENTLLKIWQKRNKLDKVLNLKAYLYTMVKNSCIDYNKKDNHLVRLDIAKHDAIPLKDQFIIEEETYALLYQALETLPEKCRRVFELSCIEGVKYKDIAEDLQISLNTVKSQRARAIVLLKTHFKENPFYQVLLSTI